MFQGIAKGTNRMETGAENVTPSPKVDSRSRRHRSSVSNGLRLFAVEGLDRRGQTHRRYRDIYEFVASDLGGESHLSELQRQLSRRAASLSVVAESLEADLVRDREIDIMLLGMVADRLRRIGDALGRQRVARPVNDGSSALADYFAQPSPIEAAE
jgi:hypothetical protein